MPRQKKQSGAAARKRRGSAKRATPDSRTPSAPTKRSRAKSRAPVKPRPVKKKSASSPKNGARRERSGPPKAFVVSLVIVGLVVITAWSFYPVARIQYRESRDKARLERELASLQERNEGLRAEVDRLKTPEGVEEIARESLGMVKDGEHAYVVTNLGAEPSSTLSAEECAAVDSGPPSATQKVLDAVFGIEE